MKPDEVRALRRKLGLTQLQLALALRVTPNTVARWEQGERRVTPLAEGALTLLALTHGGRPRKSRRVSA
jgi:DNA-binding transcriptional regulator YiaG